MSPITWLAPAIDLVKSFFGSRLERDQASAQENQAAMEEYASEFRPIENRTWWDSFIDGLNRLQRPFYTFSLLGLFWMAYAKPQTFAEIMIGFALVPEPFWIMTGIIIGFLFSSRMIEKLPIYNAFKGISRDQADMISREVQGTEIRGQGSGKAF